MSRHSVRGMVGVWASVAGIACLARTATIATASMSVLILTACSQRAAEQAKAPINKLETRAAGIVNGKLADGSEGWAKTIIGIGTKETNGYSIYCTGSLINENTIVTAAHCLDGLSGDNYVVFGLTEDAVGVQGRKIVKHKIHEKYASWFPEDARDVFDIGIAQFEGGMPFGFHPAQILSDETALADESEIILAGYGVTDGRFQTGSGILRYTSVKIRDSKYGTSEVITDEVLTGSCNGDSGGPGLIEIGGEYFLWGTTSRGDAQCKKEGIYTKVTSFTDWIQTNVTNWKTPQILAAQ